MLRDPHRNSLILPANDDVTPALKASILELAAIIGRDIAQRQVLPENDGWARPPPQGDAP